jgi:hypothetical protein
MKPGCNKWRAMHERKLGLTGTPALRPARSGHEVLRLVPVDAGGGRHPADPVATAQSESERSRGKMGAVRETGMPLETRLFGEASLRRALAEFVEHFHKERNHQGKGNILLFPSQEVSRRRCRRPVVCRKRLGGLLKYYWNAA